MPRPTNPNPPIAQKIYFEPELFAKLRVLLWSETEDRVPYGAWSAFVNEALAEALRKREVYDRLYKEWQADYQADAHYPEDYGPFCKRALQELGFPLEDKP